MLAQVILCMQVGQGRHLAGLEELAAELRVALVMRVGDRRRLGGHQVLQEDAAGQATPCRAALLLSAAHTTGTCKSAISYDYSNVLKHELLGGCTTPEF